ncbi:wbl [Trypoxylus dichotomus]
MIPNKNFILAEVSIKDYIKKENEALAKKYSSKGKNDFAIVKLFLGGTTENIHNFTATDITITNLRNFVRDNSSMYIGLLGCLEDFDNLAAEFVKSLDNKQKLKEIQDL